MRVSAKIDYALRACAELAADAGQGPIKGERLAAAQDVPVRFLENILLDLRHAGIVASQRGAAGGYWLARAPEDVSLADVFRALEGPIADVRGQPPESFEYHGAAEHLQTVWIAVRASLRSVLETTTLADLVAGTLPEEAKRLAAEPRAWESKWER